MSKHLITLGRSLRESHLASTWRARLAEEEIENKSPESVWAENKDNAETFISNTVYYVKELDGGEKYEITTVDGSERKQFGTVSRADLDKGFTPIRANDAADAEGYKQYRKVDEVQAFKYDGETVKVNGVLISSGDYLIKMPKDDQFVYEVKKAKNFDLAYTKK